MSEAQRWLLLIKILHKNEKFTGTDTILSIAFLEKPGREFDNALMLEPIGVTSLAYLLRKPANVAFDEQRGLFLSIIEFCTRP